MAFSEGMADILPLADGQSWIQDLSSFAKRGDGFRPGIVTTGLVGQTNLTTEGDCPFLVAPEKMGNSYGIQILTVDPDTEITSSNPGDEAGSEWRPVTGQEVIDLPAYDVFVEADGKPALPDEKRWQKKMKNLTSGEIALKSMQWPLTVLRNRQVYEQDGLQRMRGAEVYVTVLKDESRSQVYVYVKRFDAPFV